MKRRVLMSTPEADDDRLSALLDCRRVEAVGRPAVVEVSRGQSFCNGDEVTFLMAAQGDQVPASDEGTVLTRLRYARVDVSRREKKSSQWKDILDRFGLSEINDRIVAQRPLDQAEQLAQDMSNRMVVLHGFLLAFGKTIS